MDGTTSELTLTEAAAAFRSAVDALVAASVTGSDDLELLSVWRSVETNTRRLAPVDHQLINEIDQRGIAFRAGCKAMTSFAIQALNIHPGEAKARVEAAKLLTTQVAPSGARVESKFPNVAAALATGEISARHATAITTLMGGMSDQARDEYGEAIETHLAWFATRYNPKDVASHGNDVLAAYDPDRRYRDEKESERKRNVTMHENPDGSSRFSGHATAELTEHLKVLFDALGKPQPAKDKTPDPRTVGQRRHDALLAGCKLLERNGWLPATGGVTSTIGLFMTVDDFASGTGFATTGHGAVIPMAEAMRWAGPECRMVLTLFSKTKEVLAYSTFHRFHNEVERVVMRTRDGGCSFAGCTAPAAWTDAHHMTDWQYTHRTSVDDGALLCGPHHDNFQAMGWTGEMIKGIPCWTPPKFIDPDQVPRQNHMHDRNLNLDCPDG